MLRHSFSLLRMNIPSAPSVATTPPADFWKRKLAAFLHDPPSKALDIVEHEQRASAAYVRAGLDEYIKAYDHSADHIAAAADRMPFPYGNITCKFDGVAIPWERSGRDSRTRRPPGKHPLCASRSAALHMASAFLHSGTNVKTSPATPDCSSAKPSRGWPKAPASPSPPKSASFSPALIFRGAPPQPAVM